MSSAFPLLTTPSVVSFVLSRFFNTQLYESSCLMRLSSDTNLDMSLEKAYLIETETADYFETLLLADDHEVGELLTGIDPLTVHVAVADRITTASTTTVTAAVSLLYYESNSKTPLQLETVLTEALQLANPGSQNFAFAPEDAQISFEFQPIDPATTVLDVQDDSRSSTEIGLIVATVFLSLILLVVSSVLLHITGGWAVFKTKVSNCLFEEVDDEDDEYDYPEANSKNMYPVQTATEEEEDSEEEASNTTSLPPDSASGFLGVNGRNPAAGLGIRTDEEGGSSMMYGDTPVSQSSAPVGITSLRKMPKPETPEVRGGLSGMVMQRFARSAGKNK